jgi:hypothetical protein
MQRTLKDFKKPTASDDHPNYVEDYDWAAFATSPLVEWTPELVESYVDIAPYWFYGLLELFFYTKSNNKDLIAAAKKCKIIKNKRVNYLSYLINEVIKEVKENYKPNQEDEETYLNDLIHDVVDRNMPIYFETTLSCVQNLDIQYLRDTELHGNGKSLIDMINACIAEQIVNETQDAIESWKKNSKIDINNLL